MISYVINLNFSEQYLTNILCNLTNLKYSISVKKMNNNNSFPFVLIVRPSSLGTLLLPFVLSLSKDMNGFLNYFRVHKMVTDYLKINFFLFNNFFSPLKIYPFISFDRLRTNGYKEYSFASKFFSIVVMISSANPFFCTKKKD